MSNHSGNSNKMVSDTPRTNGCLTEILDADGFVDQSNCPQRWVNHARELERELNAANDRIKRLEEAGDALFELCDASPIQFELVDQIPQRLKAWEEAKEDKP